MKRLATLLLALATALIANADLTAPSVPGTDPSRLAGSDVVYIYNVEADAFLSYGMNWNTNAIATRLASDDLKASTRNQCHVIYDSENNTYQLQSLGNTGAYIGSNNGINDVWIDFSSNCTWTVKSLGTNTYQILHNYDSSTYPLDVSYPKGGHLTTHDGQGFTEWAFISEANITNGSYALYKAKLRLYRLYAALIDAGVSSEESSMATAAAAYAKSTATVSTLENATRTLFKSLGTRLGSQVVDISCLFTNADMLGKQSNSSWSTTTFTYRNADIEKYHAAFTLSQTLYSLPPGLYTVSFRNLVRNDGNDALPVFSVRGTTTISTPLIDLNTLTWGCNAKNSNGWTSNNGNYLPNDMLSAGQALTHGDAVSTVLIPVNSSLQAKVNVTGTTQWVNFQEFTLQYMTISHYLAQKQQEAETAKTTYADAIVPGILDALNAAIANCAGGTDDAATAYTWGNAINSLVAEIPESWPIYNQLTSLIATAENYTGENAPSLAATIESASTTAASATTTAALSEACNALEAAFLSAVRNQTTDWADMSMLITNPTLTSTDQANVPEGWSGSTSSWRWTMGTGDVAMECWNATASEVRFDMYQDITGLAEGTYEIGVEMFNSIDDESNAAFSGGECGLYATTPSAHAYIGVAKEGKTLNYHSVLISVKDGDTLRIGVRNVNRATARWFACDNFTLKYRTFESASTELCSNLPSDPAYKDLMEKMECAESAFENVPTTDNFNTLTIAVADVRISATAYAHINQELNTTPARLPYVTTAAQSEYARLLTSYQKEYDNQSIKGDGETECRLIRAALAQAVINTNGSLTVLIENNSFETGNLSGWTVETSSDTGVKLNSNSTYTTTGTDGKYLFNNWWKGAPITQNIGYLPAGDYKLSALVTSSENATYLIVNGAPNSGNVASNKTVWNQAAAYFSLSQPCEVTIGCVGSADGGDFTAEGYQWYKCDNFQLSVAGRQDIDNLGITLSPNPYYARGSQDIFGRFTLSGNAVFTEQGLCYSDTSEEPTIHDGTTNTYLDYHGKIYKIEGLKAQTAYWVRPYAKMSDDRVFYGEAHKVCTLPVGKVTYTMRTSTSTDEGIRIHTATRDLVEYWNRYTSISGLNLNVGYNEGTPTADCSYGGYMNVGPNASYQAVGTIHHEALHAIGVGTENVWKADGTPSLRPERTWIAPRVLQFIRFYENNDGASFYGDDTHGWATNTESGSISYTVNGAHEDARTDVQYTGASLLTQALTEDGLVPVPGGYFIQPHYALEQSDSRIYYIRNHSNDQYLTDNGGNLSMQQYASQEEARNADIARWRVTYDASTQFYAVTNASTGRAISHYNWIWGLGKSDKKVQIAGSHHGYFWIKAWSTLTNWWYDPTSNVLDCDADNMTGSISFTDEDTTQEWYFEIDENPGDVNNDGKISIADVTALVNIILGQDSVAPYAYNHAAADVNADGNISIADVTALVNLLLLH